MAIKETLKEHPITIGTVATIVGLLGAFAAFDARYALASDVEKFKQETSKEIRQNRVDGYEDKIFELQLKIESKQATPVDKAMLERYKNKRESIMKENK